MPFERSHSLGKDVRPGERLGSATEARQELDLVAHRELLREAFRLGV
jgi:hypothetical protein